MNPRDIKVPFPPQINPKDLLEKRRQNRVSSKSPNAFFIYRIAYLDQLKLYKHRIKMTDMSGYVSASWKNEPSHVKAEYKELARKVGRLVIDARQQALNTNSLTNNPQQSHIKQPPTSPILFNYSQITNVEGNHSFISNQFSPTPFLSDGQVPAYSHISDVHQQSNFNYYSDYDNPDDSSKKIWVPQIATIKDDNNKTILN
ncbi:20056_t:CDS:2 [Funneliformis geosporum]|uniref:20056_t:CDS:1 n=1 Tax=Funneliformis geosporum TaxID=1117311 RepID=A0A9W4WHG1_9GLOM|nr:20056_t:CDS:2 [Funneliformis geosporum]